MCFHDSRVAHLPKGSRSGLDSNPRRGHVPISIPTGLEAAHEVFQDSRKVVQSTLPPVPDHPSAGPQYHAKHGITQKQHRSIALPVLRVVRHLLGNASTMPHLVLDLTRVLPWPSRAAATAQRVVPGHTSGEARSGTPRQRPSPSHDLDRAKPRAVTTAPSRFAPQATTFRPVHSPAHSTNSDLEANGGVLHRPRGEFGPPPP